MLANPAGYGEWLDLHQLKDLEAEGWLVVPMLLRSVISAGALPSRIPVEIQIIRSSRPFPGSRRNWPHNLWIWAAYAVIKNNSRRALHQALSNPQCAAPARMRRW